MTNKTITVTLRRLLVAICGAVLGIILFAGLKPFTDHPKNDVTWLRDRNGLRFGDYGSIFGSATFNNAGSSGASGCSVEIWSRPGLSHDSNTMLAFYKPENPLQFRVGQSDDDLVVRRDYEDLKHKRTVALYVDHVFRQDKDVLVAITSDSQSAKIYVNGDLSREFSHFELTGADFTGQLVVGGAPLQQDTWSGQLRGLALYRSELTAAQVAEHYEAWAKNVGPEVTGSEDPIALYTFDERSGSVVHNHAARGPDLEIPDSFKVIHQRLLVPFWEEFSPGWGYVKDLLINIGGFIPLGFVFCAYLSLARVNRPALATILLGGAISLTIEVLQAYIPTRQSGMTDIITNTLGTLLGALLCMALVQRALSKLGSLSERSNLANENARLGWGFFCIRKSTLEAIRDFCSQIAPLTDTRL